MTITKQTVADQIAAYLHHRITLEQLVDWAENALMEADFEEKDAEAIGGVISRLGVADVRAFGLVPAVSPVPWTTRNAASTRFASSRRTAGPSVTSRRAAFPASARHGSPGVAAACP